MRDIKRVKRSKEEAKISYNKMSKWYDLLAGHSEKRFRDVGLQKLNIQEGEKVLEIGFGTGYELSGLRQRVPDKAYDPLAEFKIGGLTNGVPGKILDLERALIRIGLSLPARRIAFFGGTQDHLRL